MAELPHRTTTLVDALLVAAHQTPEKVGARFLDRRGGGEEYSFGELSRRASNSATTLRRAGVSPGDRVVLVCPTEVGFYDAFFGTLMAGATPVPVYPPLRLGKLDEWVDRTAGLVERAGARAIIADRRTRRLLGRVHSASGKSARLVKLENLPIGDAMPAAVPDPDDLALVQFSSGTTRDPAPVTLTHRQIIANIEAIVRQLPDEALEHGGCVSWLPLYHDMGLIGCVLTTLCCGETMTLIGPENFLARPRIWLEALSEYGGTVSPAPNFAYARCVEKIGPDDLDGLDLSKWVVAMNGAEPIAVDSMREFQQRFAPVGLRPEALSPVYGLAEAALAVTFSPFDRPFEATTFDRLELATGRAVPAETGVELPSLGRPLDGYDVKVCDDDGARVDEGTVGQVWVRGPSITKRYLDGEDPRVDGWFDTGDRGFLYEGELYVSGRAKDVVVVRGQNHCAHDLERACDDVAGVRPGCVVAVSHLDSTGEKVVMFVEAREQTQGLAEECRSRVNAQTGVKPDVVLVLEPGTLPRTSSGKLRRRASLEAHLAGELEAPARVGPLLIAREMARSALAFVTPAE